MTKRGPPPGLGREVHRELTLAEFDGREAGAVDGDAVPQLHILKHLGSPDGHGIAADLGYDAHFFYDSGKHFFP